MQIPQVIVSPPLDDSPPEYRKLKEFIPVYVATIRKTIDSGFLSLYPRELMDLDLNEVLWRKFIRQINESAQYVSDSDAAASATFFGVSGYLASRVGEKNVRNTKIKEINNILLCWNSSFFNGFGLQVTLIKLAQNSCGAGDDKKTLKFGTLKYYLLVASL
ncbi:hypothetical protein K450DRAFT_226415 [Umbelopsis ramanniana AG]|uniref:Uncharacterized protein n=1 Tax=Umbelopsis ramanniana AG TaxID=1314678 RepID=A0AAD5EFD5_UMBRA|nr:uncharacterized protein K450DRAFT_226415 [Umbelopsis ramanniana AG]KAI8582683.1 hypothetical protein K450DRAFT_226415 [Umbelopsis ramanniana AG]